ncbi:MAG: hypothetical protein Q8P41_05340 [Pseudomonadota bacterium]|nr:hypothetical protein [Pseudomonadota bacterium]
MCEKLVECDDVGTERISATECADQCNEQKLLYARWSDTQLREAFDDELECIYDATCDEVAEGVCYNEDVWSF